MEEPSSPSPIRTTVGFAVDFVLALFDAGWLLAYDPSGRRFRVVVDPEPIVDVVGGADSLDLYRFG